MDDGPEGARWKMLGPDDRKVDGPAGKRCHRSVLAYSNDYSAAWILSR
jgi:hypothetical protein